MCRHHARLQYAAILVLLFPLAPAFAQVSTGLDTSFDMRYQPETRRDRPSELFAASDEITTSLDVELELTSAGDLFEGVTRLRAVSNSDTPGTTLLVEEAHLRAYLSESALLQVGRWTYRPGNAEFFSPLAFFSPLDSEALLVGDRARAQRPADLVQATVFLGPLFVRGTLMPVAPEPALPDSDSIWLPLHHVPQSIETGIPTVGSLSLTGVTYGDTAPPGGSLDGMSWYGEFGGTLLGIDATLGVWDGTTVAPVLSPALLANPLTSDFLRLELTPLYRRYTAVTARLAGAWRRFRWYADGALLLDRPVLADVDPVLNTPTPLKRTRAVDVVSGLGWSTWIDRGAGLEITTLAEGTLWWQEAPGEPPLLSHAAAATLSIRTERPEVVLSITSIVSFADPEPSSAIVPSLSVPLDGSLSFSVEAVFFGGTAESELGQYRGNETVRLTSRLTL